MPHIILQSSSNVVNPDCKKLFKNIHQCLVKKLPTELSHCKSRLLIADDYYIADGSLNTAFVHLEVAIMPGRQAELLDEATKMLFNLLSEHLAAANQHLVLQLSVELRHLSTHYYKG